MATAISVDHVTQVEQLSDRLFQAALGTLELFNVHIGDQLGLYRAMAGGDALTPVELAGRAGIANRYALEWLEQQAVAGIVEVENPEHENGYLRRYRLPAGHAEVLTSIDSASFMAPMAQITVGTVAPIGTLVDAFRTGAGVPFTDYGVHLREGQGRFNRNFFLHQLGTEYLPAIASVHVRLVGDPPARIADFGCGVGYSCVAMARAYPKVRVDGFDLDEPSVADAQEVIAESGLGDRIEIRVRDAADPSFAGNYDLVTAFECLHDMSDPVGALRTMRRLTANGGSVLIVDERPAEQFDPNAGDLERLYYGFSVLHCLPVGLVDQPSAATGTVMRPATLRRYAEEAGFSSTEVLPLDYPFFNFYLLTP